MGTLVFNRMLGVGRRTSVALFLTVGAAFSLAWFVTLASRPLFEPDEGRYAEISREMLATGNWLIPHLDGVVYFEKPPLQYWATAALFGVLGESEFVARLVPGISGYLVIGLVFYFGSALWGISIGRRAAVLCVASPLFVLLGHQLTLDMFLTLFLTTCLGCFLMANNPQQSIHSNAWMLGFWIAMSLAVLTKGLVGVVIPASTILVYAVCRRGRPGFSSFNATRGFFAFCVITLPWFVYVSYANPAFFRFFFVREHFERFLTPIEHRPGSWWYFGAVLVAGTLPWIGQGCRVLFEPPRPGRTTTLDPRLFLWIWCVFIFVFFSCSSAKLIPYILPIIPALALLVASWGDRIEPGFLVASVGLSFLAGLGVVGLVSGMIVPHHTSLLIPIIRPILVVTAIILVATSLGGWTAIARRRWNTAVTVQCAGWLLACGSLLFAAGRAAPLYSGKYLAGELQNTSPQTPVFVVQEYLQSVPFYLRRTVTPVAYQDELALGLQQQPQAGVRSLGEFATRWERLHQGFAIMDYRTLRQIEERGIPARIVAAFPHDVLVSRR